MKNSTQAPRVPLVLSRTALSSLIASGLAVWATASLAQNLPPSDTQNAGNQVVVTANRIEQRVRDVIADVSVIDREELDQSGVSTVAEVLSRLPGVQISTGSTSHYVFIRGAEARMTSVYIDGVRVDSHDGVTTLGGGAPWAFIPAAQIDRIEVLRGAASAVYGSDAMGGVINIFTRKGSANSSPYVSAGFGGYGTQQTQSYKAGLSGKAGDFDYSLGAAYEDSQGYNTRPTTTNSQQGHIANSLNARMGFDLSKTQRIEVNGLSSTMIEKLAPSIYDAAGSADSRSVGSVDTARMAWSSQWSDRYNTRLSATNSSNARSDTNKNDYRTTLRGYLLENHVKTMGGVLSAVLERKLDAFVMQPDAYGSVKIDANRRQDALALGYSATMGAHSVQANLRHDADSLFGGKNTGSLAYAYALMPNLRASASSATGFKAPTLEQLYSDQYGSTTIRPETSLSHEVALRYTQGGTQVRAAMFRSTYTDLISSGGSSCAYGSFCYYNVGSASVTGNSLSAEQMLGQTRVYGSYDWLNARNDVSGKQLNLRSPEQALLGFDASVESWKLGVSVRGVSDRYEDASNTKILKGYVLLNFKISKTLDRDWQALARLDNASNALYQTVDATTLAPGRSVFIGLQWQPS